MTRRLDPSTISVLPGYRLGAHTGVSTEIVSPDGLRRYGRVRQRESGGCVAFNADGDVIGRHKTFEECAQAIANWGARHVAVKSATMHSPRPFHPPNAAPPPPPPLLEAHERVEVADLDPFNIRQLRGVLEGIVPCSVAKSTRADLVRMVERRANGEDLALRAHKRQGDLLRRLEALGVGKAGVLLVKLKPWIG
jgi:hypothetical protein